MKIVTAILIFFACIGQAAAKGGITIEMQRRKQLKNYSWAPTLRPLQH